MTVAVTGPIATREAYGQTLAALGAERTDIVVLDADLSGSTKTNVFAKAFPDRFFNMGVAEANMIGTAAGLSFSGRGLCVFASSFAMFAVGKAFEQVRQEVALPVANVKICASHAGVTTGEDGASHQVLEDIAIMRVLVPADAVETDRIVRLAAATPGPFYVRLSRMKTPVFLPDDYRFELGRAAVLREGGDLTIVAAGVTVFQACEAADALAGEGIAARVLNMSSIKPIDREALVTAAKDTGALLTVEEHQKIGGLGSAVTEVISEHAPCLVVRLGMDDRFGESGKGAELLEHFGLTAPAIAEAARRLVSRKG